MDGMLSEEELSDLLQISEDLMKERVLGKSSNTDEKENIEVLDSSDESREKFLKEEIYVDYDEWYEKIKSTLVEHYGREISKEIIDEFVQKINEDNINFESEQSVINSFEKYVFSGKTISVEDIEVLDPEEYEYTEKDKKTEKNFDKLFEDYGDTIEKIVKKILEKIEEEKYWSNSKHQNDIFLDEKYYSTLDISEKINYLYRIFKNITKVTFEAKEEKIVTETILGKEYIYPFRLRSCYEEYHEKLIRLESKFKQKQKNADVTLDYCSSLNQETIKVSPVEVNVNDFDYYAGLIVEKEEIIRAIYFLENEAKNALPSQEIILVKFENKELSILKLDSLKYNALYKKYQNLAENIHRFELEKNIVVSVENVALEVNKEIDELIVSKECTEENKTTILNKFLSKINNAKIVKFTNFHFSKVIDKVETKILSSLALMPIKETENFKIKKTKKSNKLMELINQIRNAKLKQSMLGILNEENIEFEFEDPIETDFNRVKEVLQRNNLILSEEDYRAFFDTIYYRALNGIININTEEKLIYYFNLLEYDKKVITEDNYDFSGFHL